MLEFQWFWVVALLPLPLLPRFLMPPAGQAQAALKVPHIADFEIHQAGGQLKIRQHPLNLTLAMAIWLLLLLAAARPVWLGDTLSLPISGRDLMLAVDLSGSMDTEDFELNNRRVDRLTATKAVAGDFIEHRVGDRIGLILFGRNAYLQAPLTFDRNTVKELLYESVIGLAGKETAIGDAIGLAVKRLRLKSNKLPANDKTPDAKNQSRKIDKNRVLILLTDSENTAGEVDPKKAAELAATIGLKIYTIGIGADEILVPSIFGARRVNPSRDLDEGTLTKIATLTGGRFFRARDISELQEIYKEIDKLEPIKRDQMNFKPKKSLYMWPLSLALMLAAVLAYRLSRN